VGYIITTLPCSGGPGLKFQLSLFRLFVVFVSSSKKMRVPYNRSLAIHATCLTDCASKRSYRSALRKTTVYLFTILDYVRIQLDTIKCVAQTA
jgi:hypothetical protein